MTRSECASEVLPRLCAGQLFIAFLQSTHPTHEVGAVEQEPPTGRRRNGIREGLRKGPALQINICAGVSHGRVEASVTEPLTDCGEINAGLEERHRGAVPAISREI
jgi:hypothetical protein